MARLKPQVVAPVALAALVRGAHLAYLAARDPLFRHPVVDAWFHVGQATRILTEGALLPGSGAYYKGPLYSYVLAALLGLFGEGAGVVAARVLSAACGCASVGLVALLADRLAGRAAALTAGLVAALYGTAVFYDATLLLVPVVTLGLLVAAERLVAAADAADASSASVRLAVAGAVLGLVTITRANGAIAIVAATAWAAFAAWRGRWPLLTAVRAAALVAVPAAVVVAPVTARNAVLERDPVLVSWNGGINLFMGNDPAFEQASGNWHPDLVWMRLYDAPKGIGLDRGSDHQRFYLRQSLGRALADPVQQARVLAHKAFLLVSPYEIQNNRRIEPARERSPVLAVLMARAGPVELPLGLVGPLLVVGVALGWRRATARGLPLLVLAAAWAATPVLFFNTARFRLPAVLLLLPVAAAGWCLVHELTLPRLRVRLAAAGAVLVALGAAGWSVDPDDPTLPPSDTQHLADVARRERRPADELRLRRQAVAEEPDEPMPRIRLGDRLRTAGRPDEAIEQYEAVLAMDGLAADWHNAARRSIARSLARAGRLAEAVDAYRAFVGSRPDAPRTGARPDFHLRGMPPLVACEARLELAAVHEALGQAELAASELGSVMTDCEASEALAAMATERLRRMTRGGAAAREEDGR